MKTYNLNPTSVGEMVSLKLLVNLMALDQYYKLKDGRFILTLIYKRIGNDNTEQWN